MRASTVRECQTATRRGPDLVRCIPSCVLRRNKSLMARGQPSAGPPEGKSIDLWPQALVQKRGLLTPATSALLPMDGDLGPTGDHRGMTSNSREQPYPRRKRRLTTAPAAPFLFWIYWRRQWPYQENMVIKKISLKETEVVE